MVLCVLKPSGFILRSVPVLTPKDAEPLMSKITLRTIFWFWMPLAFSMLLMTIEGPWVQAVIGRRPDPTLQLAAFGIVMSLSFTIESPIIMLLATGSALTHHRQALNVLTRFMWGMNAILTVLAILMAFTPLLDFYLGNILGIAQDIIDAVRPAMVIMIPWTAFIGYRRFYQGVMIRSGNSKAVGSGTVIRIIVSGGVAILLGMFSDLSGAMIGAWALVSAVGAEALYAFYASRRNVEAIKALEPSRDAPILTLREVLAFHMPLALTSVMTWLVRPMMESGLANTPNPQQVLAAFPVAYSIGLVLRAGGLACQEVIIALGKGEAQMKTLRRFVWTMALGSMIFAVILSFTPLLDVYMNTLLHVPMEIQPLVVTGVRALIFFPVLVALQSYYRALLMLAGRTAPIYQGMIVGFFSTAIAIVLMLKTPIEPISASSFAMTIGLALELAYLWWAQRATVPQLRARWEAALAAAGD